MNVLKELQTMMQVIQKEYGECELSIRVKTDAISFVVVKRESDGTTITVDISCPVNKLGGKENVH